MITEEAKHLAGVWQHPDVMPWVSLGLPEILTPETAQKILDMGSYYLRNDHGGFLCIPADGCVYDVHTQFRPEGRGKSVFRFARRCMAHMFVYTPAVALRTFVPEDNLAAKGLCRFCGFVDIGSGEFNEVRGRILLLTVKKWVVDTCQPQL